MKRKTLLVGLGLVPLMAVSGCIKTDKMAGRWIYTHPIPNCWTSIDVPGNGKLIQTIKLEDRNPFVFEYDLEFKRPGEMVWRMKGQPPRFVRYSFTDKVMRIKEPHRALDEMYKRVNPKARLPWVLAPRPGLKVDKDGNAFANPAPEPRRPEGEQPPPAPAEDKKEEPAAPAEGKSRTRQAAG